MIIIIIVAVVVVILCVRQLQRKEEGNAIDIASYFNM